MSQSNPASLLLGIAFASVGLMVLTKAKGAAPLNPGVPPTTVKLTSVDGRQYRVAKLSEGSFLIEAVDGSGALQFNYGSGQTFCRGECDQIVADMQKFPADLMQG